MFSPFRDVEYLPGSLQRWIQAAGAPDLKLPDVARNAMPIMLACTILEYLVAALLHKKIYYRRQTWSNIAGGAIGFVLTGIFLRGLNVFPYLTLYHFVGLKLMGPVMSNSLWVNIVGLIGFDFTHYWAHRAGHVWNIGWAGHGVHHSSPDMNLTTAFRQGITEPFVACWFYLPLALVAPPDVFFWHRSFNLLYQFFIHTEVIPKLGPLEWVLNTPSHHRVHHSRNYRRANYAGMLIIWDRMFGTFEEERDDKPCIYGWDAQQVPLGTHNPLVHQLYYWGTTIRLLIKTGNPYAALFTRTNGDGIVAPVNSNAMSINREKCNVDIEVELPPNGFPCDPRPISWLDVYVAFQSLVIGGPATLGIMRFCGTWPPINTVMAVLHTGGAFTTCGMFLDGKRAGRDAEVFRLILLAGTAWFYLSAPYVYWVQVYSAVSILVASLIYRACAEDIPKVKKA